MHIVLGTEAPEQANLPTLHKHPSGDRWGCATVQVMQEQPVEVDVTALLPTSLHAAIAR